MDPALLQTDRTGPYIALAVLGAFTLVGLYFLLQTRLDARRGRHAEEATYVFGLGSNPQLREVTDDSTVAATGEPLGRDGLRSVIDRAETRGDLNVTHLVREDGTESPYELNETIPEDIVEIELAGSRGRIRIDTGGHVRASPPLDDAVREDLSALLLDVVGSEGARPDVRAYSDRTEP